jgi:hypothetical protein
MSHSEYSLKIRIPRVLEDHLRSLSETYQLSLNDAVKMILTQHHLQNGLAPVMSPVTPKLTLPVLAEKVKVTPPSDVKRDPKPRKEGKTGLTPSSDVTPDPTLYNIINNNIFNYKDKNIIFKDQELQASWVKYQQFRKEKKKKIVPSQLSGIARNCDKVIEAEGTDGLIARFDRSVTNGWVGFVFPNEELGKPSEGPIKRKFTEDDL